MPRRTILSAFAITATALTANAADLPTQSRLGAIFAEPAEARPYAHRSVEYSAPVVGYNLLPIFPWDRGGYYYGSPWSYYNPGPYYGGASTPLWRPPPPFAGPDAYCSEQAAAVSENSVLCRHSASAPL